MDARLLTALALLLSAPPAAGSGYEALGRDFAAAARGAGLTRVSLGRVSGPPSSRAAGERLLAALVAQSGIQVVERQDIPELMSERALARSGAAEGAGPEKRLAGAQAVVLGRYEDGAQARLSARLVAVESGVILAMGQAEDAPTQLPRAPQPEPAPAPVRAAPRLAFDPGAELAAASPDCGRAAAEADRLEEEVVELKARYWAWQERRRGLDPRARPEEGITDPLLLGLFRARRAFWLAARRVPALDREETRRFVDYDGRAFALRRACGIGSFVARSGS